MIDSIRSEFIKLYIYTRKILIGSGIGKFRIVELVNNFLLSHMKKDYVVVLGNKMYLDKDDALELSLNKIYEPRETNLIQTLVNNGDVVVDIGAHIGYYTLILSKLVGDNGKVFAFEPDLINFTLLEKNIKINNCKNVVLVHMAVLDKTEKVKLFETGVSSNPNINNNSDSTESYIVDGISLDDYFKNFNGHINFIKMDIEGSEYSVLLGAKNILKNNPDMSIIAEFYPVALSKSNTSPKDFINLLSHYFRLYEIDENSGDVFLTDAEKLLQKYTVNNKKLTNLLCVKLGAGA
jgi:FkbM family methyltransferase